MAMRFTETNKWKDPWFMELPMEMKILWIYLCDNCDNAGVWDVNHRLAEFQLGTRIDWQLAINVFEGRVVTLACGKKWHLTKFLAFQCPAGLGDSNPHKQIKRLLAAHGLPIKDSGGGGSVKASESLQDQTRLLPPVSRGSAEGESEPTPTRGREGLVKFLDKHRLDSDDSAIDEWIGFARKHGAIGFDLATSCIEWCVRQARKTGVTGKIYARHVESLGEQWKTWNEKRETERITKESA
jgi:hypothetical protein